MTSIKNYINLMRLTMSTVKTWSVFTIFNSILGIVCGLLESVVLLNVVLTGISREYALSHIIISVLVIELIVLIGGFCTSIYYAKLDPIARQKIHKGITSKIIESAMAVEIRKLDDPKYLNDLSFSISQIEQRLIGGVFLIANLLSTVVGLLASIFIVGFFNVELLILIIVVAVLSIIINTLFTKINFGFENDIILSNRKKSYVERVYYMKQYSLEMRLYPIKNIMMRIFDGANKEIIDSIRKYGLKIGTLAFIKHFNQEIVLYWGAMMILLLKMAIGGIQTEPASLIPLTVAVYGLSNYIVSLTSIITSFKEQKLYINKICKFLNEECIHITNETIANEQINNIILRKVGFNYGNEENFDLLDINMSIKAGDKIAIVGENGSGKSTLIKLLLGLYSNYSGEILVDGISISKLNQEYYRNEFSVLPQDYKQYPCTIAENVLMDTAKVVDIQRIRNALELVDLEFDDLSDDEILNTPITSEFCENGITLSKGQYQKLALARIFASDRQFIVLDEPTSALDPISEYKIFNRLMEKYIEKTIFIISHRLTATKNADKIYFIESGRIIESGTHEQLMDLGGKYSAMFKTQAAKYI